MGPAADVVIVGGVCDCACICLRVCECVCLCVDNSVENDYNIAHKTATMTLTTTDNDNIDDDDNNCFYSLRKNRRVNRFQKIYAVWENILLWHLREQLRAQFTRPLKSNHFEQGRK